MSSLIKRFCLIVAAIWTLCLFFHNLHVLPLENWDEAFYADTIRYMVRTHNFIVPYWNSLPFIDKPPLYYWFGSLSTFIFGLREFSYRLPSVISALLIIVLLFYHTQKKYGFLSASITMLWMISNNLFIARSRGANLDAMATLFIVISYIILVSSNKYKYIYYGLVCGLIYLTKASLVFYLFPIVFLEILFLSKNTFKKKLINLIAVGSSFVVVISSWLLPFSLSFGLKGAQYFLFASDQGVASLSLKTFNTDYSYFMIESASKWFILLSLLGFSFMFLKWKKYAVLLSYSLLLFILLTFSPKIGNWYLMPIFPFWAIAAGFTIHEMPMIVKKYAQSTVIIVLIVLSIIQHIRIYSRSIYPILTISSAYSQKETSQYVARNFDRTIFTARLDHLYPVSVYYADRRVYSSPFEGIINEDFQITRTTLDKKMVKSPVILLGTISEIAIFKKTHPEIKVIFKKQDEVIAINFQDNREDHTLLKRDTAKSHLE